MFPMTITLQNPTQLNAVLAALNLGATAAEPTVAQMGEMARASGAANRKEADAKAEATSTAGKSAKAGDAPGPTTAKDAAPAKTADASAPAAAPAAAESQASTAVTYDVVSKAITERAKTDRVGVIATLKSFGVAKGTELKAEQYADFLKALG